MTSSLSRNATPGGTIRDRLGSSGIAAVEFAIVAPLFLLILMGMVSYGGYFWRAHSLQQIANDAARGAIAGLTPAERASLARSTVLAEMGVLAGVKPDSLTVVVAETATALSVKVEYDGSNDVFLKLGFLPMPDSLIRRNATVLLGGL